MERFGTRRGEFTEMRSARARSISRRRKRRGKLARQPLVVLTGGALVAAASMALSIGALSGVDLAAAAVGKAQSVADLLARRSPGERVAAELIKTKHKYSAVLAERG